jgi:hypothetical protein
VLEGFNGFAHLKMRFWKGLIKNFLSMITVLCGDIIMRISKDILRG